LWNTMRVGKSTCFIFVITAINKFNFTLISVQYSGKRVLK